MYIYMYIYMYTCMYMYMYFSNYICVPTVRLCMFCEKTIRPKALLEATALLAVLLGGPKPPGTLSQNRSKDMDPTLQYNTTLYSIT